MVNVWEKVKCDVVGICETKLKSNAVEECRSRTVLLRLELSGTYKLPDDLNIHDNAHCKHFLFSCVPS